MPSSAPTGEFGAVAGTSRQPRVERTLPSASAARAQTVAGAWPLEPPMRKPVSLGAPGWAAATSGRSTDSFEAQSDTYTPSTEMKMSAACPVGSHIHPSYAQLSPKKGSRSEAHSRAPIGLSGGASAACAFCGKPQSAMTDTAARIRRELRTSLVTRDGGDSLTRLTHWSEVSSAHASARSRG